MRVFELSKVFFGAEMIAYTGSLSLNHVGEKGVLLIYPSADAEDECLSVFYFDDGWGIGYVRHSRSFFRLGDGVFSATSVSSESKKVYDVSDAIELGPEVFQDSNLEARQIPEEWREFYLNIIFHSVLIGRNILKIECK